MTGECGHEAELRILGGLKSCVGNHGVCQCGAYESAGGYEGS